MKRGQHDKPGKTQEIIIRKILSKSAAEIEEPELRRYLKENENRRDENTIKRIHLAKLKKMGCLKKYPKDGKPNRWTIDKMDHVYKILEKFPELGPDLRRNYAIAQLLLEKHSMLVKEPDMPKYFRIMVNASPTFFRMCLKYNSQKLLTIAENLFESKRVEDIDLAERFYISELNFENMVVSKELLLVLLRASVTTDILNGYNYSTLGIPKYINFEDLDELNFMIHSPTVEPVVELLDEGEEIK